MSQSDLQQETPRALPRVDYRALYFEALANIGARIQSVKDSLATAEADRVPKLQGEIRGLNSALAAAFDAETSQGVDPRGLREASRSEVH